MPVEAADVIVRAMNDFPDGIIYQNFLEGIEFIQRYRIDDVDFVAGGDLNEADLLWVMVEAVGLSIKGNTPWAAHPLYGDIELSGLTNDLDRKH